MFILGSRVAPNNHSSSQKTTLCDLSYGIKIWTDVSSVLSQCTRLTDGQTDREIDPFFVAIPRWHPMKKRIMLDLPDHVYNNILLISLLLIHIHRLQSVAAAFWTNWRRSTSV